jgi:flagellar basal body-associated protein FliL
MTQQPHGDLAVQPGHPEPEPMPLPDPEPPQPIPPPEPAPFPEPPRRSIAEGADFIDAGPATDFIDAGPATTGVEWPPVGAYPGEPGHVAMVDDEPTTALPALDDQTQLTAFDGQTQLIETGWHQPPSTEPWHAQHERPGEWKYQPPERLAREHSPPAEVQPGVQDQPTQVVHPPWEVPLLPMEHEPARRRRAGLWVSMALVVTLLLCGGGATSAYLLLRNADSGKGAPDPATAVNRFMTAVYTQQDASAAGDLVCRQALKKQTLSARVDQIKKYAAEYDGPTFRWNDPAVTGQTDERATVSVQLTMSTDDEKQARQELTFTVVHKTGWLVCDIAG